MALLETKNIYLAGSGVLSFLDLSLYTQKILKECEVVFSVVAIPTLDNYLKTICKKTVDLFEKYYHEGRDRNDIYRDISNHVLAAGHKDRQVALLLHGHPLVFVTLSQWIQREAPLQNLTVEVIPAISCLDRIFVDLNLDIGPKGAQIFAATLAMGNEITLNPKVDCLLFQIGAPLSMIHEVRPTLPEDIAPLRKYLLKFYPPQRSVTVVESAVELNTSSKLSRGTLGDLTQLASHFNYTASLYIPGE